MNKRKVEVAEALLAKLVAVEKPDAPKDYQSIKLDKEDLSILRRSSSCLMTWTIKTFEVSFFKPRFWTPHKINMNQKTTLSILAFALSVSLAKANEIRGKVTKDGKGVGGVFVSAHDTENRKASGVFTAADGSYVIDELAKRITGSSPAKGSQ